MRQITISTTVTDTKESVLFEILLRMLNETVQNTFKKQENETILNIAETHLSMNISNLYTNLILSTS